MSLSHFAIARPVTVLMVVAGVLLFGAISLDELGLDLLPDLSFPMNAIITIYPNADAETIERTVTARVEDAISTVSNLKEITSMSYENISLVLAEFNWGTDLAEAMQELTAAAETLQYSLPSAAQKPLVMQFDPSQIPISFIGISSDTLTTEELTRLAKEEIVPRIERTPGVARTALSGGMDAVIHVVYDRSKLEEAGISDAVLAQMLPAQNVLVPIGPVYDDGKRYLGKVGMEIESIEELKRLVVGVSMPDAAGPGSLLGMSLPSPVYLEDVADVTLARAETEGFTRVNGRPALLVTVMKRSGENTVQVSDRLKRALDEITPRLDGVQIHYITDQATFIRRSINNLGLNGIVGAVIAAVVLLVFLKSVPSTLIISVAIPLSIMVTFVFMYFSRLTLNIMTLGGLALGVGMLVDNAIVVLENIHRHQEQGRAPADAAARGASEVASAITASTLTTLAVFLPVVFLQSFAGHLFTDLSLTVSFSLSASLLVALTVIPTMASRARATRAFHSPLHDGGSELSAGQRATETKKGFAAFRSQYKSALEWSLNHKSVILIASLLLFLGSLSVLQNLETEFLPDSDMGMVSVKVSLPPGTILDETNAVVADVESVLDEVPGIHAYSSQTGNAGTSSMLSLFSSLPPSEGRIDIMLLPNSQRQLSAGEIATYINSKLDPVRQRYPQAEIAARATDQIAYVSGLDQASLTVNISGEDLEILEQLSNQLADELKSIEGIEQIEQSVDDVQPVAIFDVNQAKALTSSLTAGQVGMSVRSQLIGTTVTELRQNGELIPVVLMSKEATDKDIDSLSSLEITSQMQAAAASGAGSSPPLRSILGGTPTLGRITALREELEPTTIMRSNGVRTVTITASTSDLALGTAQDLVRAKIREMDIPDGYSVELTGIVDIMKESLDSLQLALLLALLLVYMVMAAQFESLISPFIVMFSVPLAAIGSVLALQITGNRLGVISVVGMIVLVGIVVNNAIVMVDFINRLRRENRDLRSAILEAGEERLRPILMTASTTILGLLPLAVGVGERLGLGEATEIQAPLAIAVMGGLLTSTLLTLLVIPAVYELIHGRLDLRSKTDKPPTPPPVGSLCLALLGIAVALIASSAPATAASPFDIVDSVPRSAIPGPLRLPTLDFQGAHIDFGLLHTSFGKSGSSTPSLTNLLIVPEIRLRDDPNRMDIVAGLGVSVQYNPTVGRTTIGVTGSATFTKRRMVQFGVFRKETIAASYQWLPGRVPGGSDGPGIAGFEDKQKAGAIALAASMEMAVGRAALITAMTFATPAFDTALARAAHGLAIVKPGATGLQATVRWHQHKSVATICRGGLSISSADGTIDYILAAGAYGSPLPRLDYTVLVGAEAGVRGTVPVLDLNLAYKDVVKPGCKLILDIRKETGILSAALRAQWALD